MALVALSLGCAASAGSGPGRGTPEATEPGRTPSGETVRGSISYRAVPLMRFQLDNRDSLYMEMPDGSFQNTVTVKTAFLTFSLQPAGVGFTALVVLDSLKLDRPDPLLQPLADSATGVRWTGTMQPNGRFDSLVSSKPTVFGEQVRNMLHRLLPVLPPGGAEPGKTWIDSATRAFPIMPGFEATEKNVAEFRSGKAGDFKGTRSLVIESSITYQVAGSGTGFGQTITVEGTGRASGVHRMSTDGRLLHAQVADTARMTLTVPAVGQSVPTVLVGNYSISVLP